MPNFNALGCDHFLNRWKHGQTDSRVLECSVIKLLRSFFLDIGLSLNYWPQFLCSLTDKSCNRPRWLAGFTIIEMSTHIVLRCYRMNTGWMWSWLFVPLSNHELLTKFEKACPRKPSWYCDVRPQCLIPITQCIYMYIITCWIKQLYRYQYQPILKLSVHAEG